MLKTVKMNPEKNNHHRSLSGNRPQGLMADIISEVNIYKLPIPESDHQQQGSAGPGSTTSTSTNSSKFKPQVTPLVMSHSRSRSKSEEIFSAGIISPLSVQEQMIAGTTTLGSATPPRRINSASSTPPVSASHSRSPSGNNNQILPNSYGVGKRGHSRTHSMGRPETTDFTLQRQSSKETLTEITNSFQLRQRNNNNTDLDVSPSSDADDSRRSIVFTKKPRKPSIFKVLEKRSFSEVVWDALVSPSFFLILFLLISLGYTWKTKEEHLEQWKIKYQGKWMSLYYLKIRFPDKFNLVVLLYIDVHNNHQDLKYTHEVITADLREWKEKQSETVGKLEMLLDERKSILKELDTYKAKLGDAQADTSKPSVDRSQRARHLREEHSRKMREYVRSNDKKLQSDPKSRPDSGGQVSKIINHERQAGMSEEDLERKLAEEEDAIESLETKEEDRESLSNEIKEGSSSSSPIHHRQLSSVSNLDSLLHKGEDLTVIAAARAKYHEEVAEMDLQVGGTSI